MKRFNFLKAFNSPFKRPKFKWYVGKIAIGTPYFYPRRWVKMSPKLAKEATIKEITRWRKWNTENPDRKRQIPPYHQLYESNLRSKHAVPKKIGFDFVDLGWKTKWSDTDIRFEWSPLISFVLFKWQIVLMIIPEHQDRYWEAWLYYELHTDKTKSKKERIEQCKKEFSLTWTRSNGETKETINYYDKILKKKYE